MLLLAALAVSVNSAGLAAERSHRVQGLFCNTEDQIDRALASIGDGLDPRAAAERINKGGVFCTYVDLLVYIVVDPVEIGGSPDFVRLVKYRATLVGAEVGGNLRRISPPVSIYFITPLRLVDAVVEKRT